MRISTILCFCQPTNSSKKLIFFHFLTGSTSSSSSSQVQAEMEHLVVEVRSALNYQTDVLKEELRALSVMHDIASSAISFLFAAKLYTNGF